MDLLNETELNEFISYFESSVNTGDINIDEIGKYLKLIDLPFEAQININNKDETFSNLYCWYKYNDDDDLIKRIPEPYYTDYINSIVDNLCKKK